MMNLPNAQSAGAGEGWARGQLAPHKIWS